MGNYSAVGHNARKGQTPAPTKGAAKFVASHFDMALINEYGSSNCMCRAW